jgi:hypothetical protein
MSVQSPAIPSTVVRTASARRGIFAVLAKLLMRSAQVEAETNRAERYWTSIARGL